MARRPPASERLGAAPPRRANRVPARFDAVRAPADVRVLAAPDDAGRGIRALVASAEERLLVQQLSVAPEHAFLNATVDAARRGVEVRVLLSGKWYVREENRRVAERLNRLSRREGLPLTARLAEPRSRYDLLHVKGVVVDGERTLVGSVNWNDVSVRRNREVALVIESERVAARFERAFRADWRGGAWRVHAGTLGAAAVAAGATVRYVRRRVAFSGESPPAGRRPTRRPPSSRRGRREPPPASRGRT